jgi:chromosomal replication initiator protein
VENATEPTAEILWESIADRLREALTETTYETWFGHAGPVSLREHQLVVEVPNDFTRDWIQGHFLDFVSGVARESLGREVLVTFTVGERRPQPPPVARPAETELRRRDVEIPYRDTPEVDLNSKYTFDLFVIGSSNRFAHAAALAVAEAPAQAYNPLFIYGGTGLGKTHLLQAIGHYVRQHSRRLTMRYVTRHPVLRGEGADPGGVLPHVQLAL